MRVFLSAYSGFTLAVPMDAVAAMMLPNLETDKIMQYDQQSRSTFVSLPRLFNLPNEAVGHGIVLREWNSKVNKVVLLTAEVKRDIEIPDEEFHPIPKALGTLRFSKMFSGIQFSGNPVLLLNVEQLAEVIQEEQRIIIDRKNQPVPEEESEPQIIVEEKKPQLTTVEKSEPQVIVEEKKPQVTTAEKSEPQVIAEEKKPQLTTAEKSEPQVTAEEKKPQVATVEKSVPQAAEEENDSLVIDEIIELQAIDEENDPQATDEKKEPQTAEEESDPLVIDEIIELQAIDEENDPQATDEIITLQATDETITLQAIDEIIALQTTDETIQVLDEENA